VAAAGADMLFARKPGFLGAEQPTWMLHGTPATPGKDVRIKLVPEGRIVGRVVLPNGSPLDQVPVELYRRQVFQGRAHWSRASGVAARANGEFRFAGLEAGTYKLFTGEVPERDPLAIEPGGANYGYPPVYFPNSGDFQTAATIQITPGTTFQAELAPVRREYFPVKIPVAGAIGSQVEVHVWVQGHKGPGFSLGYNPRDQRIEGALPNGAYIVEATTQGASGASGSVNITVKGGEVNGPGMTLVPYGSLRVNVKMEWKQGEETEALQDPGGVRFRISRPGGDLNVWLENSDEFDPSSQRIVPKEHAPGEPIEFGGDLAPGRYWVRVQSARGYTAAITLGDVDLLGKLLTVGPGSNLAIDVTMRDDGAEISGTLEDADGHLLANSISQGSGAGAAAIGPSSPGPAYVYCVPLADSTGQFRESMVLDGTLHLGQISPGAYRLLVFDHPQVELEYSNREAMSAYDGKGQIVRLGPGQKENITLRIISTDQ